MFSRRLICLGGWFLLTIWGGLHPTCGFGVTPSVSAGYSHAASVKADGTVRTWGEDRSGQLGLSRPLRAPTPISSQISGVKAVSAGSQHSVALKSDGTVWAWGYNPSGQLGDGSNISRAVPSPVAGLVDVVAISAGGQHSVALTRDGGVWAWGDNGGGLLGDGTTEFRLMPVRVNGLTNVMSVAAGSSVTFALKVDGTVWAWGQNQYGEIGDGTFVSRAIPAIVTGLNGITAISARGNHTLALKSDGTVWAWGKIILEDGTETRRPTPSQVVGLSGVISVSTGGIHHVALTADGSVRTWGYNGYGALGYSTAGVFQSVPAIVSPLTKAVAIAAGSNHTVTLLADSSVWSWGYNIDGQLGNGTTSSARFTPVRVNELAGVTSVSSRGDHTLALKSDGTVWAWGANDWGQLGDGFLVARPTPELVSGLAGVASVSAGNNFTVALKVDGTVWAWGTNKGAGQLGDGTNIDRSTPAPVLGLTGVSAVSAGGGHAVALKADGTAWAWGNNVVGQLGIGSASNRLVPSQVSGFTGGTAVSAGGSHTVAVKGDGTVWAWGLNEFGQLGDGTSVNRSVPIQVSGLAGVVSVSAGYSHSIALRSDGTVWAWGRNSSGELGDNTFAFRATPRQVNGISGVIAISAGIYGTLALKGDGSVWMWGYISGTTLYGTPTPAQVIGLSAVAAISTGNFFGFSLALKTDGTVVSWGRGGLGQLGDGTYVDRNRPVVVVRENGVGSISSNDWFLDLNPAISKRVDLTPAFLALTSAIGGRIDATVKHNTADIGKTASTYVFALAPANLVKGAMLKGGADVNDPAYHINLKTTPSVDAKEGPLGCVLAQLNSAGQLTAVSASNLQAYVTGVLSAGGTAVNVLNNISAAAIQGSTFYVGYGTSGTSMINNGVNRSVVTVPGTQNCQPQAPQTGWWWDPVQRDRGYGIEVRGNNLYYVSFMNNPTGTPSWMVASGPTALDGSLFQASLYSYANGQTLTGAYKAPTGPTTEGLITISTATATQGTLIAPTGTRSVTRMEFIPNGLTAAPQANQPESGWWWNKDEPGRGYFIEWQSGYASVTGYMYDDAGKPIWYQSMLPTTDPRVFNGTFSIFGNGYPVTQMGSSINRKMARLTDNFQPLSIRFSDASNGVMTLPGGRNIAITRLRF